MSWLLTGKKISFVKMVVSCLHWLGDFYYNLIFQCWDNKLVEIQMMQFHAHVVWTFEATMQANLRSHISQRYECVMFNKLHAQNKWQYCIKNFSSETWLAAAQNRGQIFCYIWFVQKIQFFPCNWSKTFGGKKTLNKCVSF